MKQSILRMDEMLYSITASEHADIDNVQKQKLFLADKGVATFGTINTELLKPILEKEGHTVERSDLCLTDDQTLGLEMPHTWYMNRGANAISIPMYYNFLYYKEMAKENTLFTKNASIAEKYGRIGMIEVYLQHELESFLKERNIDYFGTPRTLTECMRVLEGWDIQRVPRLKSYVSYARSIKSWCKKYYPEYDEREWNLGEQASNRLLEERGTTNVRAAIKFYWQKNLLARKNKIRSGDVEIDILSERFYQERQPAFILLGEDILDSSNNAKPENVIKCKTYSDERELVLPRLQDKNDKNIACALAARSLFPKAKILMFNNPPHMPNFTMCKLDEIKQGINREVAIVTSVLQEFIQNYSA